MTNEGACNVLENCAFYLKDGTKYMKPEHEQQFRQAYEMAIKALKAQPEDYTKLKQEFLRMASYIDVLLECSDEQKETLLGFISRLAEFMPWTERD